MTGDFDYGVMAGLGWQQPVAPMFALTAELDTYFSKEMDWGSNGWQLDGRIGARIDL